MGAAGSLDAVLKAVDDPKVFVFGELLDEPNVQGLAEKHPGHLELLKLFAFGTFADFRANPGAFGALMTEARLWKLKKLSLVTMSAAKKVLLYSEIQAAMELPDTAAVEQLITESVYAGLIEGKLDQRRQEFLLQFSIGRDISPAIFDDMVAKLGSWDAATSDVLRALQDKASHVEVVRERETKEGQMFASEVVAARETFAETAAAMMGGRAVGGQGAAAASMLGNFGSTLFGLMGAFGDDDSRKKGGKRRLPQASVRQ